MAVILQTARLTLRPHTAADFATCCTIWTDPEVTRFIGGRPSTEEEVWFRILRYAGLWSLLGYGYFLALNRETGAVVGEFGIADFHRDITPSFGNTPEAGWIMLPGHHGKGLAYEAMSAVLAWAAQTMPPHSLHDRSGERAVAETGRKAGLPRLCPHRVQGQSDHPVRATFTSSIGGRGLTRGSARSAG